MKYFTAIFFVILFGFSAIKAQDTIPKLKLYKSWIYMQQGKPYKIIGVLYEFKDSTILISNSFKIKDYQSNNFETQEISIQNIKEIEFRKNNNVGKGAWIGALSGLVVGTILGYSMGDTKNSFNYLSFSAEQNAVIWGVGFTFLGAAVGAVIGSTTIQIPINGSMDNYKSNYDKLNNYGVIKR